MVKQVIQVGTVADDGTGDKIRDAFVKVNANFDELYEDVANNTLNIAGAGSGGIQYSDLSVLTASASGSGALAYNNTNGVFTFTPADISGGGGGSTYTDSDAIAAVVGADLDMGGNKVLFGNVYDQLSDLPNATNYHGMFAHVHATGKGYFAHAGAWVELANMTDVSGGGSSLQTRTTKSATANSLANDASASLTIDGFKGYALYSIQTSHAAWVRLYISTTARTNDASRTINTDPTPDAGVVAEVITTAAETVNFGPAVLGYCDTGTSIYATVTNKSGGTQNVAVTLTVLQLES